MKLEVGIGLDEFGMMMVMTFCPALMISDDCVATVDDHPGFLAKSSCASEILVIRGMMMMMMVMVMVMMTVMKIMTLMMMMMMLMTTLVLLPSLPASEILVIRGMMMMFLFPSFAKILMTILKDNDG